MKIVKLLWLFLISNFAYGQETSFLELKRASIDIYRYYHLYDAYLAPEDKNLGFGSNWNLDLDVFKYKTYNLYWNNRLHFDQSKKDSRIKHAGWEFEMGSTVYSVNNKPKIQIFNHHHSRHILEDTRDVHFPVYDTYGFRLILIGQ